ncbi:hypothetical protein KEJ17_07480 [Candidatus Bathyarchaeota archaeon]|nr:hypothetical protein [Candidatus Bathyarchaeota archaeon]
MARQRNGSRPSMQLRGGNPPSREAYRGGCNHPVLGAELNLSEDLTGLK